MACGLKTVIVAALLAALQISPARAESVTVKYRGEVNLAPFECTDVTRSSFVQRVCYDAANQYMLINLKNTYYHYCEIGVDTVNALLSAPSTGKFYNAHIRGTGGQGPFDCRTHRVPNY